MKVNPHRSSLGMDANVMALLCYIAAFVLAWIPIVKWVAPAAPLVIFFIEKESPFVKFHAMQAFILEVVNWVLSIIFSIILSAVAYNPYAYLTGRGWGALGAISIISTIVGIALTVFAIIALIKAYGYFEYKIPLVGNFAMKFSRKGNP